MIYKQ